MLYCMRSCCLRETGKLIGLKNLFKVDECQTDCHRAGEKPQTHGDNTVVEDFLHKCCLLGEFD